MTSCVSLTCRILCGLVGKDPGIPGHGDAGLLCTWMRELTNEKASCSEAAEGDGGSRTSMGVAARELARETWLWSA